MWDDQDLADVTLACEERKQSQAHKFILSAYNPFFKKILRNNKHSHSMIYKETQEATKQSILWCE